MAEQYHCYIQAEYRIRLRREYRPFIMPRTELGYLAGEFPGGITTVDGAPSTATIRVMFRAPHGHPGDGSLVAEVQSAIDGTWRVGNLPVGFRYDVVGRKIGFNDVIIADVSPAIE